MCTSRTGFSRCRGRAPKSHELWIFFPEMTLLHFPKMHQIRVNLVHTSQLKAKIQNPIHEPIFEAEEIFL